MNKIKKITTLLIALSMLICSILMFFPLNNVQARERTEDLTNLVNYPEIYTAVQELKTAHPNWTFTILYTGLDWNDVIRNETTAVHTRSLVYKTLVTGNASEWVCSTCGMTPKDNGNWYCASDKTVSYYMDPRNWLNETYIFAFETLSFNSNAHTLEGVKSILAGTFMDVNSIKYIDTNGNEQTINKSYAEIIYEAGKKFNISPYHLAARIRQEQGNGGSGLISGRYTYTNPDTGAVTEYVGYYNYFNIAASGNSTAAIIRNGLERAIEKEWTSPEASIYGGAEFLTNGYIGQYQDSLYLQKYHVDSQSKYSVYGHQYQQNVSAPYTESLDVYDAYEELGILESNFNFIIPVYDNMPSTPQTKPGRLITLVTEDVIVQTESTPLSIRSGPSTDYSVKGKAPKGTKLIRIESGETLSSDGRNWDRVIYNTGSELIIGYASREYLQQVDTVEVLNEPKTIETMCNLRNGPSTTYTRVKKVLPVGTQVTVIDKVTYKLDGHIWYRVKLQDGTQGYISEAFTQKQQTSTQPYITEGEFIKIVPGTQITEIPGATLNSSTLGTGATITLNGTTYSVVLIGDVSGDGSITPADYVKIKNNIMGATNLDGVYKMSADVNRDGNVTPADYVKVKNHIMNVSKISL